MQDRKKEKITLKQYIHSNSLRKQALSRASSRQSRRQPESPTWNAINSIKPHTSIKENLIKQIKVKIAEHISQEQSLIIVLKMFDRVIQLYNQEIKQQRQEIEVLNTIIRQHNISTKSKHLNTSDKQSRILIEGNSEQIPSQFSMSFHPTRTQHQALAATNNSKHIRWLQESHNTSEEKDQIPNIRLLLQTRNKQTQHAEEQTKQTQENNNTAFPDHSQSIIQSFGLDKTNSQRRRRASSNSTFSNQLDPAKFFNHEQEPSQIRFSIRSSTWNNNFDGISLRKTYQPEKSEI